MTDVVIMSMGMVYMSVCTPDGTSKEVIEEEANKQHPTGLSHGWKISEDEEFADGHSNPCPCETMEGRQHTLLSC